MSTVPYDMVSQCSFAYRFKKELKKRKVSVDQYSSFGECSTARVFSAVICKADLDADFSVLLVLTCNVPADDGLKYYDQAVGSGEIAEKGKKVKVGRQDYRPALALFSQLGWLSLAYFKEPASFFMQVHFDCMYKGIDVVSSRQARLLGGNRTISEVRSLLRTIIIGTTALQSHLYSAWLSLKRSCATDIGLLPAADRVCCWRTSGGSSCEEDHRHCRWPVCRHGWPQAAASSQLCSPRHEDWWEGIGCCPCLHAQL